MSHSVAIIGSFQKYYEDIVGLITVFNDNGFFVTSPFKSKITDKHYGFVIFAADDKKLSDVEIQTDTLRKILNADAVYVYNPEGYVGKTTCYEIGILMAKNKPIYYLMSPADLPVPVSENQIVNPQAFIEIVKNNSAKFSVPKDFSDRGLSAFSAVFGTLKYTLLVCGSMRFYDDMKKFKYDFDETGIRTIIPEDESSLSKNLSPEEAEGFKRKVSQAYFRKIREPETLAILVFNEEKNGVANYIGANTLAEIVMAFTWNRKIFLLNDIYTPLSDELRAWNCTPIHKNFDIIKSYFINNGIRNKREDYQQTSFLNFIED